MRLAELAGRRIGIIGFGQEGRSAFDWIRRHLDAPDLTVFNEAPLDGEPPAGVEWVEGPLDAAALAGCEVLIKSPGVSLYRPEIEQARQSGARLTSVSQLWFAEPRAVPVIAVTGSKGKSTTVSLIEFLLNAAGYHAVSAGNIGQPLSELWTLPDSVQVVVVELSSYQTADFEGVPDVAVLTNLFPEHLDWHGSLERYFEDKLKLFAGGPDHCLVNGQDPESLRRTEGLAQRSRFAHPSGWEVGSDEIRFQGQHIAPPPQWHLIGDHNHFNLAAAISAVHALGIDPWPGLSRLEAFQGLPHRLQVVGEANGITLIDDSISTAPEATAAALEAMAGSSVAVIVGGHDRGLDWQPVARCLTESPVDLVITQGASGSRIAQLIRQRCPKQSVESVEGLEEAVEIGMARLGPGGFLLLSPGAPSYDQFADYRERGERFRHLALNQR